MKFLFHAASAMLRDRLMLGLTYSGALRRAEVTALTIGDLDFARRLIRVPAETTKNRRERIVYYPSDLAPVLTAHLAQLRLAGISG